MELISYINNDIGDDGNETESVGFVLRKITLIWLYISDINKTAQWNTMIMIN